MKKKFSKRKTYNKRIQIPTPYGPISGSDMKELALGACFVVGTVLLVEYSKGLVKKFFQDKNTDNKIRIQNNTTQNRIKEMKAEEELARKKAEIKVNEAKALDEIRHKTMDTHNGSCSNEEPAEVYWLDDFLKNHPMPETPWMLSLLVNSYPQKTRPAIMLFLLALFGTLCFSRIRAPFGKKKVLHAPNFLLAVEGPSGQGKGEFEAIYKKVFGPIIDADAAKLTAEVNNSQSNHIIQTLTPEISEAELVNILKGNQGVHVLVFSPELSTISRLSKNANSIWKLDTICRAFDNSMVSRINTRVKASEPLYLNLAVTGTPGIVNDFLSTSVESGATRRFSLVPIPMVREQEQSGYMLDDIEFGTLQSIIDGWRKKYVYTTDDQGNDVPCPETELDLTYLQNPLDDWAQNQILMGQTYSDSARESLAFAISTQAFHFGMVLHMLYHDTAPHEKTYSDKVVNWTLYIANLLMERFLHRFGRTLKSINDRNKQMELVQSSSKPTVNTNVRNLCSQNVTFTEAKVPLDVALEMKRAYDAGGESYGYVSVAKDYAPGYNLSKSQVKNLLRQVEVYRIAHPELAN